MDEFNFDNEVKRGRKGNYRKDPFGDFDSFDDFDMDFGDAEKDRTPVNKVRSSLRRELTSRKGLLSAAKAATWAALPSSYQNAFEGVGNVKREIDNEIDSIRRDLEPTKRNLKALGRTLTPLADSILPQKMALRYRNLVAKETPWTGLGEQSDDDRIATTLKEIFGAQYKQADFKYRTDDTARKEDRKIEDARFSAQNKLQAKMTQGIGRLVGYQDSILIRFHSKSLELQQRQYFATRDLLELTKVSARTTAETLAAIQKNTALPDLAKVKTGETYSDELHRILVGTVTKGAREKFSGMLGRFTTGLGRQARTFTSTFNEVTGMLADQLGDGQKDEFSDDPMELVLDTVTGNIRDSYAKQLGTYLGKKAYKNKAFRKSAELVDLINTRAPRYINEITASDTFVGNVLRDIMGTAGGRAREGLGRHMLQSATTPVPFDYAVRTSLVEIIPAFLSHQLQQLETIATGKPADRYVFSPERQGLVRMGVATSDARRMVEKQANSGLKHHTDAIIDTIDRDKKLSAGARQELAMKLYKESLNNRLFDYASMSDPTSYAKHGEEIASVMAAAFGKTTDEGEIPFRTTRSFSEFATQLGKRADRHLRGNASNTRYGMGDDDIRRRRIVESRFDELTRYELLLSKNINAYGAAGSRDILRNAGIIDSGDSVNQKEVDTYIRQHLAGHQVMSDEEYESKVLQLVNTFGPEMVAKRIPRKPRKKDGGGIWDILTGGTSAKPRTRGARIADSKGIIESIQTTSREQVSWLERIHDRLGGVSVGGNAGPSLVDKLSELIDQLKFGTTPGLGGRLGKTFSSMARKVGGTAGDIVNSAFGLTGRVLGGLSGAARAAYEESRTRAQDLYLRGQRSTVPIISGALIKAGVYLKEDGTPLRSLKEISGNIYRLDESGQRVLVLSASDIANTVTAYGRSARGLFSRLVDYASDGVTGVVDRLFKLPDVASSALRFAKSTLKPPYDVYVVGEKDSAGRPIPRLRKFLFLNGGYRDFDGRVISHPDQINGPVYDVENNLILSSAEIANPGICRASGEPIVGGTLADKIGATIGGMAGGAKSIYRGLKSGVKALGSGLAGLTNRRNNVDGKSSSVILSDIYEHMRTVWPVTNEDEKHIKRILKGKRRPGKQYKERDTVKNESVKQTEVMQEQRDIMEEMLGQQADSMDFEDIPGMRKPGWISRLRERLSKKKGKKTGSSAIGRLVGSAVGGAGKLAGGMAKGIGKGLGLGMEALSGLLPLLMRLLPYLAGAGAVAAAGYAGYKAGGKIYKHVSDFYYDEPKEDIKNTFMDILQVSRLDRNRDLGPIEMLRMMYYGVAAEDEKRISTLRLFEQNMIRWVRIDIKANGVATLRLRKKFNEIWEQHAGEFGCDPESEIHQRQFSKWFYDRFFKVFSVSVLGASKLKVPLFDIDKKLKNNLKASFVRYVRFTTADKHVNADPLSITRSPWPDEPLVDNVDEIKDLENKVIAASERGTALSARAWGSMVAKTKRALESTGSFFNKYNPFSSQIRKNVKLSNVAPGYSPSRGGGEMGALGGGINFGANYYAKGYRPGDYKSPARAAAEAKVMYGLLAPSARAAIADPNGLIMPVDGIITSWMGNRTHPVSHKEKMHKGVDIAAPVGTPVRAAADGIISWMIPNSKTAGNMIVIDHPDGRQTRYLHLAGFAHNVSRGVSVIQGQVIGYVGNTGIGTGPHLHFEYRDAVPGGRTMAPGTDWSAESSRAVLNPFNFIEGGKYQRQAANDAKAVDKTGDYVTAPKPPMSVTSGSFTRPTVAPAQTATPKAADTVATAAPVKGAPAIPSINFGEVTSVTRETAANAGAQRDKQLATAMETNQKLDTLINLLSNKNMGTTVVAPPSTPPAPMKTTPPLVTSKPSSRSYS